MIKFIKRTLLFILIVALIAGGFIVYQGHQVYKNALNSISLADKIEKIKKDDSYVELSSLPSDYKNAVKKLGEELGVPVFKHKKLKKPSDLPI